MILVTTPLNIDSSLRTISLEANVLSNMITVVRNVFPDLLTKLSSSLNLCSNIKKDELTVNYTKEQKFVLENIVNKQYLDLAELSSLTPEGFQGKYLDYVQCLDTSVNELINITNDVLKPYSVYLSQFISTKDFKLSTKDNTKLYQNLSNKRNEQILSLNKFKSNTDSAKDKIGNLITRKQDIELLYKAKTQLVDKINTIDLTIVEDSVKRCVDLLNIIIEQINNGDIVNITPEVTKNLAYGSIEIAREVEYLAMIHYKVLVFNTVVDDMTKQLNNYIKNIY